MNTHNYRNKVTYLSLLLSILIVYRHAININIYNVTGATYWIQLFVSHLTDTIVPCFFALSAFLFYQNYSTDKIKNKLTSRVKTLIIPFILWSFIGYLFVLICKTFIGERMNLTIPAFNIVNTFKDIFIYTKYNTTWFLLNLIVYTYTFPILYRILKSKIGGLIVIITFLYLGYLIRNSIIMYAAPYALGCYFGIHYKNIVQKQYSNSIIALALTLFVASIAIETYFNFVDRATLMPIRILQIIMIWIIADKLAIEKSPKWWMTISFFIYCSHSKILESYEKVILIIFKDAPYAAAFDFISAPLFTIATIYLLASLLRKNNYIWNMLTGGRTN